MRVSNINRYQVEQEINFYYIRNLFCLIYFYISDNVPTSYNLNKFHIWWDTWHLSRMNFLACIHVSKINVADNPGYKHKKTFLCMQS